MMMMARGAVASSSQMWSQGCSARAAASEGAHPSKHTRAVAAARGAVPRPLVASRILGGQAGGWQRAGARVVARTALGEARSGSESDGCDDALEGFSFDPSIAVVQVQEDMLQVAAWADPLAAEAMASAVHEAVTSLALKSAILIDSTCEDEFTEPEKLAPPPPAENPVLPWYATTYNKADVEMLMQVATCAAAAIAEPLLGMIDTVCIGQLGLLPLAAMAPNNTIFGMINQLATFTLVVTVANKVAAALGAGDNAERYGLLPADVALNAAMTCGLVMGAVIAAAFVAWPTALVNLFGGYPETVSMARNYFIVRAIGIPAALITMILQGAYSAALDLKKPLLAIVACGVLNGGLDLLCIFGFNWGLGGAALATTVAQYAACALLLKSAYCRDREKFKLKPLQPGERWWWEGMLLDKHALPYVTDSPQRLSKCVDASRAFRHQSPSVLELRQPLYAYQDFLSMCVVQTTRAVNVILAWTLCNLAAARLGTLQAASHQLVFQFQMFQILAMQSFCTVSNSVCARAFHSGGLRAARQVADRLQVFALACSVALGLLTWTFREKLPMLFTSDVAVHLACQPAMFPVCCMIALTWFKVPEGALLGVGDGRFLALCYVPAAACTMLQLFNASVHAQGLGGVWLGLVAYYSCLGALFSWRWYALRYVDKVRAAWAAWRRAPLKTE